jgi:hypothetical protein
VGYLEDEAVLKQSRPTGAPTAPPSDDGDDDGDGYDDVSYFGDDDAYDYHGWETTRGRARRGRRRPSTAPTAAPTDALAPTATGLDDDADTADDDVSYSGGDDYTAPIGRVRRTLGKAGRALKHDDDKSKDKDNDKGKGKDKGKDKKDDPASVATVYELVTVTVPEVSPGTRLMRWLLRWLAWVFKGQKQAPKSDAIYVAGPLPLARRLRTLAGNRNSSSSSSSGNSTMSGRPTTAPSGAPTATASPSHGTAAAGTGKNNNRTGTSNSSSSSVPTPPTPPARHRTDDATTDDIAAAADANVADRTSVSAFHVVADEKIRGVNLGGWFIPEVGKPRPLHSLHAPLPLTYHSLSTPVPIP